MIVELLTGEVRGLKCEHHLAVTVVERSGSARMSSQRKLGRQWLRPQTSPSRTASRLW